MAARDAKPTWTPQVESLPEHIDTFEAIFDITSKSETEGLPKHLKYAFIGDNNTLPVIIAANFDPRA
jgi:hypothetical protein